MSHTINHLRKPRLQRSELAVPGSNPDMIAKAASSAADFIFLDIEDAVAPPDKEQARRNIIEALNGIDWRARGKAVSVRINGLDTHYMYRDVVDVMEHAGDRLDTHPGAQGGRARRPLHGRGAGEPDRGGQGLPDPCRSRSPDRNRARHGQCRSDRGFRRTAGGAAFRRRRLCGELQGAHRQHWRAQSRLSRRSVALRAVAHDGRLPRLWPARDRRSVRRFLRSGRLHGRRQARRRPRHRGQVGDPSLADRACQ